MIDSSNELPPKELPYTTFPEKTFRNALQRILGGRKNRPTQEHPPEQKKRKIGPPMDIKKETRLSPELIGDSHIITGKTKDGEKKQSDDAAWVGKNLSNNPTITICDGASITAGGQYGYFLAKHLIYAIAHSTGEDVNTLVNSIQKGWLEAKKNSGGKLSASTVSTAIIDNNKILHFAHAGDSRLYAFNDKAFWQMTTDHDQVAERAEGIVQENPGTSIREARAQAKKEGYKSNILTRYVSTNHKLPQIQTGSLDLRKYQVQGILAISDGLILGKEDQQNLRLEQVLRQALQSNTKNTAQSVAETALNFLQKTQRPESRRDDIGIAYLSTKNIVKT